MAKPYNRIRDFIIVVVCVRVFFLQKDITANKRAQSTHTHTNTTFFYVQTFVSMHLNACVTSIWQTFVRQVHACYVQCRLHTLNLPC